jgi:hypothetical protein
MDRVKQKKIFVTYWNLPELKVAKVPPHMPENRTVRCVVVDVLRTIDVSIPVLQQFRIHWKDCIDRTEDTGKAIGSQAFVFKGEIISNTFALKVVFRKDAALTIVSCTLGRHREF